MELFVTKLPLKPEVTREDVLLLINRWLVGSKKYAIDSLNYSFEKESYEEQFDFGCVKYLCTEVNGENIFACRFVNEKADGLWIVDTIFKERHSDKSVRITLSYFAKTGKPLASIWKPYLVKLFFESHYCSEEGVFPVLDSPILLTDKDVERCAGIMNGTLRAPLPVVYISVDSFRTEKYAINPKKLAYALAGRAHILVEPDANFAKSLREKTDGKNPYRGYIGIFIPGAECCEMVSLNNYFKNGVLEKDRLRDHICMTVQKFSVLYETSEEIRWNDLMNALLEKQLRADADENKQLFYEAEAERQDIAKREKSYKLQIENYKEDVRQLKDKILALQENFSAQKMKEKKISVPLYYEGIEEYHNGEISDCVLNLIKQAAAKLPKDNKNGGCRMQRILDNLIKNNDMSGEEEEFFTAIEVALKEKTLEGCLNKLKKLGFSYERGKHIKLLYQDYQFEMACTPSDYRANKNFFEQIKNVLSVRRKI